MNKQTLAKLQELKNLIGRIGHSNKPALRLRTSMARVEYDGLLRTLTGSARRGFLRGKIA